MRDLWFGTLKVHRKKHFLNFIASFISSYFKKFSIFVSCVMSVSIFLRVMHSGLLINLNWSFNQTINQQCLFFICITDYQLRVFLMYVFKIQIFLCNVPCNQVIRIRRYKRLLQVLQKLCKHFSQDQWTKVFSLVSMYYDIVRCRTCV